MPGPYRECQEHGWLEIAEYTVDPETGAVICPVCRVELSGRYGEVGHRETFGGPTHRARDRFVEAVEEYHEEVENDGH